jgi:hypothetical protein
LKIVIVSVLDGQGALLIAHMNTLAPAPRLVIVVVGDEGVVIVPAPLTRVQVPVPTVGVLPAIVAELLHPDCVGPAFAVVGEATPVIVTVEVEGVHGGLLIVQVNTFGPTPNPVTPEVGEEGVVMVPVPLVSVHAPVPAVGVFPASVAVVPQTLCAGPAFDVVGVETPVIVTVEVEGVHGGLLIVQVNTFGPTPNPVKPEVGEDGVVMVPVPLVSVQVPVPTVGVFPASVAVVPQTVCAGPALDVVVGPEGCVIVIVAVPGQPLLSSTFNV